MECGDSEFYLASNFIKIKQAYVKKAESFLNCWRLRAKAEDSVSEMHSSFIAQNLLL